MEINKLVLKNFRTHKKLELAFDSGITGIVGNNGTGKSSIVEAISFLLTGDGYGAKTDMLSVGEASGYVLGHLKIAGKEAVLERHLDSSKVAFKYDGITYKKSGEVAELWDQLFQLDKNIFKNVVIARQGETALLFSGDNATKERIFQKIFLVPNTTKVRDIVWNKYIKTAPPEYPVIDEEQYLKELISLESQIDNKKTQLAQLPDNIDSKHVSLAARLTYLHNCQAAQAQREVVLNNIATLTAEQETHKQEIESIKLKLATIDYHQINAALQQLLLDKPRHTQKVEFENSLNSLQVDLKKFEDFDFSLLTQLGNRKGELRAACSLIEEEYNSITAKITDFKTKGLVDSATCPYCGSELKDMLTYITHLEIKLPELLRKLNTQRAEVSKTEIEHSALEKAKKEYDALVQRQEQVKNALEVLKDVRFDPAEYALYSSVITQYDALVNKKDSLNNLLQELSAKIINHNVELITIPGYDNTAKSLEEELEQVTKTLTQIKQDLAVKRELEIQLVKAEQSLQSTQRIFDENKKVKEKNEKRNRYLYLLNELYELLHTSQFPRKLIQTYAGTVSEYLNEHLQLFNFPYTAKVNDNFGIDVFDTSGFKLPAVSGGQEVMLGVALRLSLHNMFGAAFPMMILDEGSVHLSNESKKSYFEIIKNLKKISNFKQIIIVDHDEDLSSVVDHTIKL